MPEINKPSSNSENIDEDSSTRSSEKRTLLSSLFPFLRQRSPSSLRDDLTDALAGDNQGQIFTPEERTMLNNILSLGESRVDDIMIPRSQMYALELETSLGEAMRVFESSGHSRLPVYSETLDDPRGMIHIRDVLNYITSRCDKKNTLKFSDINLKQAIGKLNLLRTVLFVPGSMLASQLLSRMQSTRTQMALVIDEYGGTDGLVSMEDIVELVVGDIEDEHDDEDNMIFKEADDVWVVDARAELEEVEEALNETFQIGELREEVDTIGGLVVSLIDRIPARGEMITSISGYNVRIVDADTRRIKRLRIKKLDHVEPA